MARQGRSEKLTAFALLLMVGGVASCDQAGNPGVGETQAAGMERWSYQDWPTGPYQVALDWPKPLPDDRHSHDGWTWGSMGGVYAESPDRIWVAMRGELPLPEGAAPWTAYGATNLVGNATGNGDGIGATCNVSQNRRGWERRFEHSIIVLDGDGNLVDEWPYADELFSQLPCGRGPHQIKMSPYDPEKHVWIIDDQLHVIYKFTYDGELVLTHGTLGCSTGPPTSLGCRTARTSSATATAGPEWLSSTRTTISSWTGGSQSPIGRTRSRTSFGRFTASRSGRTAAFLFWTAETHGCRSSTRTARSSTCGRSLHRTGATRAP